MLLAFALTAQGPSSEAPWHAEMFCAYVSLQEFFLQSPEQNPTEVCLWAFLGMNILKRYSLEREGEGAGEGEREHVPLPPGKPGLLVGLSPLLRHCWPSAAL